MSTSFFPYDLPSLFSEAFDARCKPLNNPRHDANNAVQTQALRPRMDLHENSEANTVTATFEFPGLTKENVQINIHSGRLNISAESKIASEHEEDGYVVRERRCGKLARTLQLPRGVKEDQINARMENGILTVTFPKTTPEMAPKKIAIA